jgi:hypothetical protein
MCSGSRGAAKGSHQEEKEHHGGERADSGSEGRQEGHGCDGDTRHDHLSGQPFENHGVDGCGGRHVTAGVSNGSGDVPGHAAR